MKMREINIKENMPNVEDAKRLLLSEMTRARFEKIHIIKVVHGYGSTGKGGAIKLAIPAFLKEQIKKNLISDFICGEEFSAMNEKTRMLLSRYPELKKDRDYGMRNIGITIVVF